VHRELLESPHIGSYSALLLLALAGGYVLTRWRGVRSGIPGRHIDNMMLLVAVLSLFGARLFSWIFYFPPGISLWTAMTSNSGGMVFYGGLIFGTAAVLGYARAARLAIANLLDACAPGVALGLAIGRIGCFMAGCCWGDLCISDAEAAKLASSQIVWQTRTFAIVSGPNFPLAVCFPADSGAYRQHSELGLIGSDALQSRPVHPVQLYEAALALVLCVLLHRSFRGREWTGQIAVRLALGYAAIRFFTEFLRADNPAVWLGLTLSQVISLLIAAVALAIVVRRRTASSPLQAIPLVVRASAED